MARPEDTKVGIKTAVEILVLVILAIPGLYFHVIVDDFPAFHRGFFCDDRTLMHPFIKAADQQVNEEKIEY